ncbi:sulfite exporter TauE/SafE family protein [Jiella sp. M17.18]|uniref:sulfite exporter TauE/SafE family protein n=1 Tax=Jiella sp. M17.18 TaxID=3234247 RepID=UPI0034DE8A3D
MLRELMLFFLAGLAGGVVNAAAGGAKLFVFPLLLASGLPAIAANATGTVALWPATLPAAWLYRRELAAGGPLLVLLLPAMLGALTGALVLVSLPAASFLSAVPVLLALAATAILFGRQLPKLMRHLFPGGAMMPVTVVLLFGIGFYGGYFGAGMGFMLLAVLSATTTGDLHHANARKNVFAFCINSTAVVPLAFSHHVDWVAAPTVLLGGLIGGYASGRLLRFVPDWLLRLAVAGLGLTLTIWFLAR